MTDQTPALWQDELGTAADYSRLYTAAAALIRTHGYTAYPNAEGERGTSVQSALCAAALDRATAELRGTILEGDMLEARAHVTASTWFHYAELRLGAVLYLLGQQNGSSRELGDAVNDWEMHWNSDAPRPTAPVVLAVLEAAAALMGAVSAVAEAAS